MSWKDTTLYKLSEKYYPLLVHFGQFGVLILIYMMFAYKYDAYRMCGEYCTYRYNATGWESRLAGCVCYWKENNLDYNNLPILPSLNMTIK